MVEVLNKNRPTDIMREEPVWIQVSKIEFKPNSSLIISLWLHKMVLILKYEPLYQIFFLLSSPCRHDESHNIFLIQFSILNICGVAETPVSNSERLLNCINISGMQSENISHCRKHCSSEWTLNRLTNQHYSNPTKI